jgi:azobenzene reductase
MARTLTVVGLGGSIARVSTSRAALQVALAGAADEGAATTLLDLRELDLPMFNPEVDEPTPAARELIEACHAADGGTPLEQPALPGNDLGRVQERPRLAAPARRSGAALPARQGDRAD